MHNDFGFDQFLDENNLNVAGAMHDEVSICFEKNLYRIVWVSDCDPRWNRGFIIFHNKVGVKQEDKESTVALLKEAILKAIEDRILDKKEIQFGGGPVYIEYQINCEVCDGEDY